MIAGLLALVCCQVGLQTARSVIVESLLDLHA